MRPEPASSPTRERRRPRRLPRLVLPLIAILAAPGAALAGEYSRVEPLWLEPLPGEGGMAHRPLLLNLPMGWQSGDAAVVLVSGVQPGGGLRDRLIFSLLDAGAAVLEVSVRNAPPGTPPAEEVLRAGSALQREVGAGLVVAVGLGMGGAPGVLLASAHPGFVAHLGIVGPEMAFVPGPGPVAPQERWPERAGPFCAAIAWAVEAAPTPLAPGGTGGARAWQDCSAALVPRVTAPRLTASVRYGRP